MCVQYIGGIPWVHRGDVGGIPWVHRGMFSTSEGYHEYIGGISWVHRGMFSTSELSIEIEGILSSCSPKCIMISLRCTEHPPMSHGIPPMYWTSLDVLMVSPHIHHDIPSMYWTSPDVLMISPDVLMISPRCTEHPPMYWTSPDVLNTHYTGWCSRKFQITVCAKLWFAVWHSYD